MKQKSKIIIVGGGTAGLVSALLIKRRFQNVNIEIVKSQKIGIIGVGEGSTENFTDFVRSCNLNENELINRSDATIKGGILFLNWYKDMYFYNVDKRFTDIKIGQYNGGYSYNYAYDLPHFDTTTRYLAQNLINPNVKVNQYHFNTFKLNEYLIEVCKNRNIKITDDEIVDVSVDDDGISKLKGEKDEYVADFYIDSTGFKKILISKLGAKWQSYGKYLKMNQAIAFPTEDTDAYNTYSLARAMKYGWMWRTPTNGRWGNGYIFNNTYIDSKQAQEEIEGVFGRPVNIFKDIKFDPGSLDKVWIKNCLAIGLSANFLEPLHATSIGSVISQVMLFTYYYFNYNQKTIDNFNDKANKNMIMMRDFICLHYNVKKYDSQFWIDLHNIELPDTLKDKLNIWQDRFPIADDFSDNDYSLFYDQHWSNVLSAMEIPNRDTIRQELESMNKNDVNWIRDKVNNFTNLINNEGANAIAHKSYLQNIRSNI